MTAKSWYWTGLGLLILSLASSGVARCWMGKTSGLIDELRVKAAAYLAVAELAMGRTQAGLGDLEAVGARLGAEKAHLQAAQARLAASGARSRALAGSKPFDTMKLAADDSADLGLELEIQRVAQETVVGIGRQRLTLCPQREIKIPLAVRHAPIPVFEDPM
ncbi:MAG: hypothetical protein JO266_00495 [Acidobacteria bacterium]|nr:hypothetical protein [Acidobacteriota bacterium]